MRISTGVVIDISSPKTASSLKCSYRCSAVDTETQVVTFLYIKLNKS